MQTIKTAVVVVLLLGVCYGAFVALNAPDPDLFPEIEDLQVDQGPSISVDIPQLNRPSADISPLTPPNLSPSFSGPTASKSKAEEDASALSLGSLTKPANPLPPTLHGFDTKGSPSLLEIDSPKLPGHEESSEFSDLTLPLALEGSSVPLPPANGLDSQRANDGKFVTTLDETPTSSNGGLSLPPFFQPGEANRAPGAESLSPNGNLANPTTPPSFEIGLPPINPSEISAKVESKKQVTQPFKLARDEAIKLATAGKMREALAKMSPYHNHIELTREENADLVDLLDSLAGEVIYSRRHLLESPFTVNSGETLEAIASRFRVSPETLMSINMMGDSKVVLAGSKLKVLNGPFRGDVNLTREELTLFLGDLYAGSFAISIGKEPAPIEGEFQIDDRRRDRMYYGNSQVLPATDNRNPFGGYWMKVGKEMSIHGSPATPSPQLANAGCISLAPLDAKEVYTLLTHGSQVTIHR